MTPLEREADLTGAEMLARMPAAFYCPAGRLNAARIKLRRAAGRPGGYATVYDPERAVLTVLAPDATRAIAGSRSVGDARRAVDEVQGAKAIRQLYRAMTNAVIKETSRLPPFAWPKEV